MARDSVGVRVFRTLRREVGLDAELPPGEEPDRGALRVVASAVIVLTGLVLLVPNVTVVLTPAPGLVGLLLALLGTLVSTALVAAGLSLYHSRFSDANAVRIAAWNVLGVVVLGLVLLGLFSYQVSAGGEVVKRAFFIANLLAIGAAAHVVIGVFDARRVRAEQLAAERRKLAGLNRVLRHSLRGEASSMLGHTENIAETAQTDATRESAAALRRHVEAIGELADEAETVMDIYERHGEAVDARSLRDDAETAVETVQEDHPDAVIEMDVPEGLSVHADPALPEAIEELVENGVVHGDADEPRVKVRAAREAEWVALEVRDNGPGIPEAASQVVTGDSEITQLTHGSGLGLWVAQAVVDASNGRLDFGVPAEEGTVVTLRLPPA